MKIRTQRVHHMGSSNRDNNISFHDIKNVFETSYIKSQSSYYKTAQSLHSQSEMKDPKTKNPFQGTHVEMETKRWNSKAKRQGVETQWKLQHPIPKLDYSHRLNEDISQVVNTFAGKDVNIFKLNQLKKTFIKNNSKKRNMKAYFQNYASGGKIGTEQMKRIVREYGYDITEDEVKLIFKLTGNNGDGLAINEFVQLMTKDNVYFRTLKIPGLKDSRRQIFDQKIHLVLRNKFNQLKEAFRIYRMRGEQIDEEKFNYVMKKLDLNDLVITKAERNQVFQKFQDQRGNFNVQRLLGSIVEQETIKQPSIFQKKNDFQDNLNVKEQSDAKKYKRQNHFDFKRISNLQYEKQMFKAQQVLGQLKKLNSQSRDLVTNNGGSLSREQVRKKVEHLLQTHGINFNKYEYDCFASYLDYNHNNKISGEDFKHFIDESPKTAQQRFDRRIRMLPPEGSKSQIYDQQSALESLQKVKSKKFNPQMKTLFQQIDKDKDGYLSKIELKDKLQNLAVLQNWQVNNLVNYFDPSGKGYVNYAEFAEKYTNSQKQIQEAINEPINKLKSHSDWISTKRSLVKEANTCTYNVPSKYSAWPERLKRTDFSLIQAPIKAGQYASEDQRFNLNQKHNLAQQFKQQKNKVYENRLRKLVAWNEINQGRIQNKSLIQEQRSQANDYAMRITKQAYETNAHNN